MPLRIANKFLKQLSKREKYILYATLALILASIVFNYIFDPLTRRIKSLNEGLVSKQLKLAKGQRLLALKGDIEEEFSKIAANLKFEGTQEQLTSALLNKIEKLSSSSGVHITNIKPQRVKGFGFYQKMMVEIKLDATIAEIIKFLYDLECLPEDLIEIERIQLNTEAQESDILNAVVLISKISLL